MADIFELNYEEVLAKVNSTSQVETIAKKVEQNKVDELKKWIPKSGLDVRKFFNTSGMKYRELNIKEKIKDMSEDEIYELLASDGMLIKRPLFISDTLILKGFKEKEWEQIKGENNAIN